MAERNDAQYQTNSRRQLVRPLGNLGATVLIILGLLACTSSGVEPSMERRDRLLEAVAGPPGALEGEGLFGSDVSRVLVLGPFATADEAKAAISPAYSSDSGMWSGGGPGFIVTLGSSETFIAWYPVAMEDVDLSCLPGASISVREVDFFLEQADPVTLRLAEGSCSD